MDKEQGNFRNLLKATRVKRTFPVILMILIPPAVTGNFSFEIIRLILIMIFGYMIASLYNAHKDNDYVLPRYFKKIIFLLILLILFISWQSRILFVTAVLFIFLGFVYNTVARFIVLGDAFVAGFTHFVIPFVSSSLISGLDGRLCFQVSIMFYFISICMGPTTNLKDIVEDKERGYRTLVNTVKYPNLVAGVLFEMTFVLIVTIYIWFSLVNWIMFYVIFILKIFVLVGIYSKRPKFALNFMRLYFMVSFVGIILLSTESFGLIISGFIFVAIYFIILFIDIFRNEF